MSRTDIVDAKDVLAWIDFEGNTTKEQIENAYKKIGKYITNNAKELAADVKPNISEIELKIKIPADYVVTLEKKINYYVMNEKENENE